MRYVHGAFLANGVQYCMNNKSKRKRLTQPFIARLRQVCVCVSFAPIIRAPCDFRAQGKRKGTRSTAPRHLNYCSLALIYEHCTWFLSLCFFLFSASNAHHYFSAHILHETPFPLSDLAGPPARRTSHRHKTVASE